ncbi:efflux RND transporter permease subunit [Brucepastera parasyntrophica]|uniref:efflux RND transporter permease subunit n=1 Tax=Brucepastera parasyntrophica TaxID=2880008 RepID=UPI002109EA76|nr:efflux RND transporter permease subunit [Brucepastera parasyntrophica]ULQ59068.1 efflux RND transporter permease subunit [Brucepastera parasyntrophica]
MGISKTAVNKPTTVLIIFIILTALGIYATFDLPLDLLPDIELPYVAVVTTYPGAGPEEVEKRLSRPIESALSSVSGIEYLGSSSSNSSSVVYIQLTYGTNLDESMNEIREKLDYIKSSLPDEASTPMIYKMNPDVIPIMAYVVSGNRSQEELRDYAEDVLPKIEQLDGVASAYVTGGRERAIRVEIPRDRLQAYDLTITQVAQMIGAQNIQIAGGTITENDLNYTISTVGEYKTLDDIRNTVISYKVAGSTEIAMMGGPMPSMVTVRLRDIADVFDGFKDPESVFYFNGEPCVQISVQKKSGYNSVQTARSVQERMEEIIRDSPADIQITEVSNTTDIIQRSVDNVVSSTLSGALLAVIILFIFLRSFRSTLIIGLTIPISLIITLGIMYFTGNTLNLMTLAGLALGVGMLVDNSIVILENIYTYREKGAKPTTAAILGSQEMILAISASTLTTICVFLPLIMYRSQLGMVGEIFEGLAFTVVISLVCSLVVAIVLVPVLSSKYFKIGSKRDRTYKGFFGKIDYTLMKFFEWLDSAYASAVRWILRHKLITIGTILVLLIISLAAIPSLGFEYMPSSAADSVDVSLTMPVGTQLETTEAVLRQLEQSVYRDIKGYESVILVVGTGGMFGMGGASSYMGSMTIYLPPVKDRIESEEDIKQKLRGYFNEFPGASFTISDGGMMSMGGGSTAVNVKVKSEDLGKARETAHAIKNVLTEKASDYVTEPTVDLQDGLPQVNIVIDRERLYNLGLNIYSVGQEIRANIAGVTASRFREDGEETDIVVTLAEQDKTNLKDLEQIFVTNSQGVRIPVSSFASYEEGVAPISITRENQSRIIQVTAGTVPGVSINDVQRKIESLIQSDVLIDPAVRIEYGGDYKEMMEALQKFAVIILMAIVLVFGVMASQFESLLDPFIVLFTIPLTVVGIVFIYAVMGQKINVMTAVGVLILVGVIVNNGIVLVDYTNLLRKRGLSLKDACAEAARSRLRPILMTTLTTVLGLIPMAFAPGEGSEMVQPIGQTVLGGLSFGTLMTLFLMPVLYYIFNRIREKRDVKKQLRRERKAQLAREKAQLENFGGTK